MPADLRGPDVADLLDRMDARRRRRARSVVASVLPTVLLAAFVLTASREDRTSLRVADEPTPTTAAPSLPVSDGTSTTTDGAAAPPIATTVPAPSPPPSPGVVWIDDMEVEVGVVPAPPMPDEPAAFHFEPDSEAAAECERYIRLSGDVGPPDWCFVYGGDPTFVAGTVGSLSVLLCHGRFAQPERVAPIGGIWFELSVARTTAGGKQSPSSWAWHRPSPPAEIDFGPGDCARWTIWWAAVDDFGEPLPPGTYRVRPEFTPSIDVFDLPVDITVTAP